MSFIAIVDSKNINIQEWGEKKEFTIIVYYDFFNIVELPENSRSVLCM